MSTLRSQANDDGASEVMGEVPVRPGDVLAGKYRVERVLGQGGMGVVVSALHLQLDERVAIKFLLPAALENADTVQRFAREARAAVRIKNEHVARVSDVGTLENGAPYMVMEYLEGQDLSDVVQSRGPLPVQEAIDYVLQTCEAIAEAHSLGIVHRDLKPSNLFLTRRSDGAAMVKVLDFGISKVKPRGSSMSEAALTKTASVMGSPLYMAPEQMVSTREVDVRADIWALGVVLYQLLAATAPFTGDTMTELCARILQEPPPPLRAVRQDVHPSLEAAILRCLEKDRERRFATVAELAQALGPFGPAHSRISVERAMRMTPPLGHPQAPLGFMPTSLSDGGFALPPSPHPHAVPPSASPHAPLAQTPMPAQQHAAPPAQVSTLSSWGQTQGSQASGGSRVWIVAIVGVCAVFAGVLVGLVVVLSMRSPSSSGSASHASTSAVTATTLATGDPTDAPIATLRPTPTSNAPTYTPGVKTPTVAAKPDAGAPFVNAPTTAPPTVTAPTATAPAHTATSQATSKPDIF